MRKRSAYPVGAGAPAKNPTRYMAPAAPVFAAKAAPTGCSGSPRNAPYLWERARPRRIQRGAWHRLRRCSRACPLPRGAPAAQGKVPSPPCARLQATALSTLRLASSSRTSCSTCSPKYALSAMLAACGRTSCWNAVACTTSPPRGLGQGVFQLTNGSISRRRGSHGAAHNSLH